MSPIRHALTVLALGLGSSMASAQQTTPAPSPSNGTSAQSGPVQLQEVTVTGSRIRRTTDFTTPTPTTVIDTATMQNMGIVNVGAAATLAPANVSTFTPANTGNSNFFTGEYIPDLRGLNPYFGSRTLLLINGQRVVNSTQGDSFDMNLIPSILVSRIDTVTGGASAAYGSGAIAGVMNVIIDTKLEGGKVQGSFYQTSHSDGRDRNFGAAWGHGFLDDRLHFFIGGEYENQDGIECETRSWCQQGQGEYQMPPGNTAPSSGGAGILGYGYDIRSNMSNYPGVLFGLADFGGYQGGPPPVSFTPDGMHTAPFPLGTPQVSFADSVQGGGGTPVYQFSELLAPVNRGTGMAGLNGKITDWLNFKTDFLIAREQTTTYSGAVGTLAANVFPQNAFACPDTPNGSAYGPPGAGPACANAASPDVAAAVDSGAFLSKDWSAQVPALTRFTTNVQRFTFGLDGQIGDSSWTWDANYEYGLTHHDQLVQDNYSLYRILMALDSVNTPNGPECRVTADGFAGAVAATTLTAGPGGPVIVASPYANANPLLAQGCVPIDPFGTQPLTAQQLNYAWGNLLEQLRYEQTDANINFSGNYFRGVGAGPFSAAVGYEWRQEVGANIDQPGQPAYLADDFETQYGSSFGGIMTVNEGYIETNVPLFRNLPGAHLLEFDLAGRESRYVNRALYGIDVCTTPGVNGCPLANAPPGTNFTHNFFTWKASGLYEPVDGVRFRATQSRDERAPNFRELYYNQVIGAGGLFGQCGPFGTTFDPCTWNLLGNPNLKPESSNTTTIGIVLTPQNFVSGLQFSADWFHIKINNAIEQANPTLLENTCKANPNDPAACAAIQFNSNPLTAAGTPCPYAGTPAQLYAQGCYNLASIAPTSYNGAFYEVMGIDFSFNYVLDLGKFGGINTRLLTTWMDEQKFQSYPGGPIYNIDGQTGTGNGFLNDYTPTAKWRGSLMVTWTQGPLSITPNMSFVSHGVMDYLGVTPAQGAVYQETIAGTLPPDLAAMGLHPMPRNYVPSYFLFGLNGTYSFENVPALKGLQLFVQINNLFNKTPPFTGGENLFGAANIYGGTNPIFFDTAGLAWRGGFRLNF